MVEYNAGLPVALVEYKLADDGKGHRAPPYDLRHATPRAIAKLAEMAGLPFLLAYYWSETWAFYLVAVNDAARKVYGETMALSERRFVKSLYHLRSLKIQEQVLDKLSNVDLAADAVLPRITR